MQVHGRPGAECSPGIPAALAGAPSSCLRGALGALQAAATAVAAAAADAAASAPPDWRFSAREP